MRIMKWKDAVIEYGTFLYTNKECQGTDEWSEQVYVNHATNSGKVCSESFPSTIPESHYQEDYDAYQDNIESYERGESTTIVSYIETSSDILDEDKNNSLIIVYDNEDIDVWISKLNFLKR